MEKSLRGPRSADLHRAPASVMSTLAEPNSQGAGRVDPAVPYIQTYKEQCLWEYGIPQSLERSRVQALVPVLTLSL